VQALALIEGRELPVHLGDLAARGSATRGRNSVQGKTGGGRQGDTTQRFYDTHGPKFGQRICYADSSDMASSESPFSSLTSSSDPY
jgi:hypothetical protein